MPRGNKDIGKPSQNGSLFITDLEDVFFGSIVEELMVGVVQSFVLYYQVDGSKSEVSNIYGETTKVYFKNPVKIFCIVEEDEGNIDSNQYGMDQKKTLVCWMHRRRLEEVSVVVQEGDFIEFGGISYQIITAIDTRFLTGVAKFRDTIKVTAVVPESHQDLNK
jgi:hypothetical protein